VKIDPEAGGFAFTFIKSQKSVGNENLVKGQVFVFTFSTFLRATDVVL